MAEWFHHRQLAMNWLYKAMESCEYSYQTTALLGNVPDILLNSQRRSPLVFLPGECYIIFGRMSELVARAVARSHPSASALVCHRISALAREGEWTGVGCLSADKTLRRVRAPSHLADVSLLM